jgi:hypothetical protein
VRVRGGGNEQIHHPRPWLAPNGGDTGGKPP